VRMAMIPFRFLCPFGWHIWSAFGLIWLTAAALVPLAVLVAWILGFAESGLPVSVLICAGYLVFEATSFSLEWSWSYVGLWHFWRIAAPLTAVQALLCMKLANRDALGGLLLSSLCLGLREALFELQSTYSTANAGLWRERLTASLLGGGSHAAVLALVLAVASGIPRAVAGFARQVSRQDSLVAELACLALALPIARCLARAAATSRLAGLTVASSGQSPTCSAATAAFDTLVLRSDILFALTVFVEGPFLFAFLLIPRMATFCVAVVFNALLDVTFYYVMNRRWRRVVGGAEGGAGGGTWSPTYWFHRPDSALIALSGGGALVVREPPPPSETTRLAPQGRPGLRAAAADPEKAGSHALAGCGSGGGLAMSPRVTVLLDEYDAAAIRAGRAAHKVGIGGLSVYLWQEHKLALSTQLLGTGSVALSVVLCAPAVGMPYLPLLHGEGGASVGHAGAGAAGVGAGEHDGGGWEYAARAALLLVLRSAADFVAWRWAAAEEAERGLAGLLQSRHELASFQGWLYRALVGACPLFPVFVGLSAGP